MMAYKAYMNKDYNSWHRKNDDEAYEDNEMKKPEKNPKKRRRFNIPEEEPHNEGNAPRKDKDEAESDRHSLPKDKRLPKEARKELMVSVVRQKMKKMK